MIHVTTQVRVIDRVCTLPRQSKILFSYLYVSNCDIPVLKLQNNDCNNKSKHTSILHLSVCASCCTSNDFISWWDLAANPCLSWALSCIILWSQSSIRQPIMMLSRWSIINLLPMFPLKIGNQQFSAQPVRWHEVALCLRILSYPLLLPAGVGATMLEND